jgi:hypothetical protein
LALLFTLSAGTSAATNGPVRWTARNFTFNPVLDGNVIAMVAEPGGTVVVSGLFQTIDGLPYSYFARLKPDGSVDASFTPPVSLIGAALNSAYLGRQSDGRLIVAGSSLFSRLNIDGSVDPGFKGQPTNDLGPLLVLRDDRLVLATQGASTVVRLMADGAPDPSFREASVDPAGNVRKLATDFANRVLLLGSFSSVNGTPATNFARLGSDGTLDATFQPAVDNIQNFEVMSDDGVVVAAAPTSDTVKLARLDALGHPLPQFLVTTQVVNCCGGSSFQTLLRLDDNCIVVGESDCGHGSCLNTAWLFDGLGRILVPAGSQAILGLVAGPGGFGALTAASTNTYYAAVLNRLMKLEVVRGSAAGLTFMQPSIWVPQGTSIRLPVFRQGDTGAVLNLHYRITTADGSTDYGPIEGAVTVPSGAPSATVEGPGPNRSGTAPERLLTATLLSADGGTVFGLTEAAIHVVSDYEAARAPYLRVSQSLSLSGLTLNLELWHFAPGHYGLEASQDLEKFTWQGPIEINTLESPTILDIGDVASSAGYSFYRVVTAP